MLFGSALLVALGVTACGGDGGNRTGTGSPDAPSASEPSADPATGARVPGREADNGRWVRPA